MESQASPGAGGVVIVGAGLAGLCCALHLQRQGQRCTILEAANDVGGRIQTELVDGFLLDRGFQVFLTSYPEAQTLLDYDALQLQPFLPGARIRYQQRFYDLTDPWRRPFSALRSVWSPTGTLADKLRVARLRSRVLQGSVADRFAEPDQTTLQALQSAGFTPAMIDRFFRPFLGGIFLDPQLDTSSRMLSFVFRMFSLGSACLPAAGMAAIPRQLASRLQPGTVRLNTAVRDVQPGTVTLQTGETLAASSIVIATEGPAAAALLPGHPSVESSGGGPTGALGTPSTGFAAPIATAGCGTTCLYFVADHPPVKQPLLILNGDGGLNRDGTAGGPINSVCIPTQVAPSYGPAGRSLISVTVLGTAVGGDDLLSAVLTHLTDWFGPQVAGWSHLRTYFIPYALPAQAPPALVPPERGVSWSPGVYICGDHRDNASIEGAMVSGRRAADAILKDQA